MKYVFVTIRKSNGKIRMREIWGRNFKKAQKAYLEMYPDNKYFCLSATAVPEIIDAKNEIVEI